MAFLKSDADAIRTAITEAVKSTLARIDPANDATRLRESAEQRDVRLKEARRQEKTLLKETARSFQDLCGFDKKQARKAAKAEARRFRS